LSPGGVTIQGQVTDVFGNKFVLEDGTGRTLVETGPEWHNRIDVRPGERLEVVGRPDGGGFDAFRIKREDGREITVGSPEGPPPWGRRVQAGEPRRGAAARPPRGRAGAPHPRRAARTRLEQRGYTPVSQGERKPKHVELVAEHSRGELVELHAGLDGEVYKGACWAAWPLARLAPVPAEGRAALPRPPSAPAP
jgi:hypothetical protein